MRREDWLEQRPSAALLSTPGARRSGSAPRGHRLGLPADARGRRHGRGRSSEAVRDTGSRRSGWSTQVAIVDATASTDRPHARRGGRRGPSRWRTSSRGRPPRRQGRGLWKSLAAVSAIWSSGSTATSATSTGVRARPFWGPAHRAAIRYGKALPAAARRGGRGGGRSDRDLRALLISSHPSSAASCNRSPGGSSRRTLLDGCVHERLCGANRRPIDIVRRSGSGRWRR